MGAQDTGKKVVCPCCKNKAQLLISRTKRFLFLCHNCGLQCFSRGELAQRWFSKLVREAENS